MGRIFFLVNIRTRICPLGIQSVYCLDEIHYRGIHIHSAKPEKSQQVGCFRRWCCLWHRDVILCLSPFTPLHLQLALQLLPSHLIDYTHTCLIVIKYMYHGLANVANLNAIGDHSDVRLITTKHTIIISVRGT